MTLLELLLALAAFGLVLTLGLQAIQADLLRFRRQAEAQAREAAPKVLADQIKFAWEGRASGPFSVEPWLRVEGRMSAQWTRLQRLELTWLPEGEAAGNFVLERGADGWLIDSRPMHYAGEIEVNLPPGSYPGPGPSQFGIRFPEADDQLLRQGFAFAPDR